MSLLSMAKRDLGAMQRVSERAKRRTEIKMVEALVDSIPKKYRKILRYITEVRLDSLPGQTCGISINIPGHEEIVCVTQISGRVVPGFYRVSYYTDGKGEVRYYSISDAIVRSLI